MYKYKNFKAIPSKKKKFMTQSKRLKQIFKHWIDLLIPIRNNLKHKLEEKIWEQSIQKYNKQEKNIQLFLNHKFKNQ